MPKKTKQDQIVEALGAVCERLDKVLGLLERLLQEQPPVDARGPGIQYKYGVMLQSPDVVPVYGVRTPPWSKFKKGGV